MLGLTATGKRVLAADGGSFNHLFPSPVKADPIINPDASVEATVRQMVKLVEKYNYQTEKLAKILQGKTIAESTRNIWDFIYKYIQYSEDLPGVEQLRTPARTWADREKGVDCDCMSIFASSLLTNMGIPHQFRIVKYGKPDYQHVYVVVPGSGLNGKYIVIDGVVDRYDYELEFTQKKDFSAMNGIPLQVLNGTNSESYDDRLKNFLIGQRTAIMAEPDKLTVIHFQNALPLLDFVIDNWDDEHDRASAIFEAYSKEQQYHKRSKLFDAIVRFYEGKATCEDVKKAAWIKTSSLAGKNVLAEYGLAAPRQAFLLILSLNLFHYAEKMAPAYFGGLNDETAIKYSFSEELRQKYASAFGMTVTQQRGNRDKVLKILKKWHDVLGGDWSSLKNATMQGSKKLLVRVSGYEGYNFWKNFNDWSGKPDSSHSNPVGIGSIEIDQPEQLGEIATATVLTAAAAVIAALAPIIGPLIKPGNADPTISDADDPLNNPALLAQIQAEAAKQGYSESGSNIWKTVGIITGVAAVIGGIAYLLTNKKSG